jgi:hypothetical protein
LDSCSSVWKEDNPESFRIDFLNRDNLEEEEKEDEVQNIRPIPRLTFTVH